MVTTRRQAKSAAARPPTPPPQRIKRRKAKMTRTQIAEALATSRARRRLKSHRMIGPKQGPKTQKQTCSDAGRALRNGVSFGGKELRRCPVHKPLTR